MHRRRVFSYYIADHAPSKVFPTFLPIMHLIEADNLRAIAIKTGFCHIVVSYIIFSGRLDAASAGVSALNGSEIGQATQY